MINFTWFLGSFVFVIIYFFAQGNTIDVRSKDPLDLGVAAVNMKTGQPVFSLDVQVS